MASHIYKLAVHKLKDVETMANYFENTPKYTVWTPKMILRTAFWGFAFPYGLYKLFQPLYNYQEVATAKTPVDYSIGADLFTEYGTAGGKRSHSKHTSL